MQRNSVLVLCSTALIFYALPVDPCVGALTSSEGSELQEMGILSFCIPAALLAPSLGQCMPCMLSHTSSDLSFTRGWEAGHLPPCFTVLCSWLYFSLESILVPYSVFTCPTTVRDSSGSQRTLWPNRAGETWLLAVAPSLMYLLTTRGDQTPGKPDDGCSHNVTERSPRQPNPQARSARRAAVETLCPARRRAASAKTVTTVYGAKHAICMGSNSARWCINFFFLFTSENTGLVLFSEGLSSPHLNYSKVVFG